MYYHPPFYQFHLLIMLGEGQVEISTKRTEVQLWHFALIHLISE